MHGVISLPDTTSYYDKRNLNVVLLMSANIVIDVFFNKIRQLHI